MSGTGMDSVDPLTPRETARLAEAVSKIDAALEKIEGDAAAVGGRLPLAHIPTSKIKASLEPLRDPKCGDIAELAASMKATDQLVPVLVKPNGTGYTLVYGHRRWLAAKKNRRKLLAFVANGSMSETDMLLAAITENMAREDMTDLEKGRALAALKGVTGWTSRKVAGTAGVSEQRAKFFMALDAEPDEIKKIMRSDRQRSLGTHVEATRKIESEADRVALLKSVVKHGLTQAETRRRATLINDSKSPHVKNEIIEAEPGAAWLTQRHLDAVAKQAAKAVTARANPKPKMPVMVKKVLNALRGSRGRIPDWRKAIKSPSFGKESLQFMEHQVMGFVHDLELLRIAIARERNKRSS